MSAIADLRPYLRHLLGDMDADCYEYADVSLDLAVRTMIAMGKLEDYSLSTDRNSISPDLTDPNDLALLLYETVRSFISCRPDSFSFRTRGYSQSTGSWRSFLTDLDQHLHELKEGTMFLGWQSFGQWYHGVTGVDPAHLWTRVELNGPTATITYPES